MLISCSVRRRSSGWEESQGQAQFEQLPPKPQYGLLGTSSPLASPLQAVLLPGAHGFVQRCRLLGCRGSAGEPQRCRERTP